MNAQSHPMSVTHLVFGLIFLGTAGAWTLGAAGVIETGAARWVVPLILIVAGGAGLVASVAKSMTRSRPEPVEEPLDFLYEERSEGQ